MRPRALIALALTAVGLGFAALAWADTDVVRDEINETKALRENGRVDIVKAIAGHQGPLLKHTIVVREGIDPKLKRERPLLAINVRGNPTSDPEYLVYDDEIFKNPKKGHPEKVATAQLSGHGKRWVYRFDPRDFPDGGLGKYGWAAFTATAKATLDVVPSNGYATHRP
jgi:hypothetical protein